MTTRTVNQNPAIRREQAREELRAKLVNGNSVETKAPPNPWRIILGQDPDLKRDTYFIHMELCTRMGVTAYSRWIELEHPYLLRDIPLVRVWWVLARKLDELNGVRL